MQAAMRHGGSSDDRGWEARLTLAAVGGLGFLILSGVAIWLLPFGLFTQWTVLLHTGVGVAALLPLGWYLLCHWRTYWRHPVNDIGILGYAATIALVVCLASGVVVTWQALLDVRTGPLWRVTHRWSTVAVFVFTLWHVAAAAWRIQHATRIDITAQRLDSARRIGMRVAALAVVPLLLLAATTGVMRLRTQLDVFPANYEMWETDNPLIATRRWTSPSRPSS